MSYELTIRDEMGNERVIMIDADTYQYVKRVLHTPSPIAMKLWSAIDIERTFEERYKRTPTSAEVDKALNCLDYDALEDCTDEEWEAIDNAVVEAMEG